MCHVETVLIYRVVPLLHKRLISSVTGEWGRLMYIYNTPNGDWTAKRPSNVTKQEYLFQICVLHGHFSWMR